MTEFHLGKHGVKFKILLHSVCFQLNHYIMQTRLSETTFDDGVLLEGVKDGVMWAVRRGGEIQITFRITLGGRDERRTTIWLLLVAETFVHSFLEVLLKGTDLLAVP